MNNGSKGVLLEIVTPEEMFYSGSVEMLAVPTTQGQEGFLPNHVWCVKLLAEKGRLKFREQGASELQSAEVYGGYVDIRDHFVVYTDKAVWNKELEESVKNNKKT